MGTRIPIPVRADTLLDNSEVLMSNSIPWYNIVIGIALFTSIVWLVGADLMRRVREGKMIRAEAERLAYEERERHKARSRQNNLGRRVYNILHKGGLLLISQPGVEDGPFEIQIETKNQNGAGSIYLHIYYDFVSWPSPYQCRLVCLPLHIDQLVRTDQQQTTAGLELFLFGEIGDILREIRRFIPPRS